MPKGISILVLSDNEFLIRAFRKLDAVKRLKYEGCLFQFAISESNQTLKTSLQDIKDISYLTVKRDWPFIVDKFSLVISLHCKQIFPAEMVSKIRCINIHPGYNPFNRGWFPQVFSIINKKSSGVTIHEIDDKLDHGPVIFREQVEIFSWDTSLTAYQRILEKELELLSSHLESIVFGSYNTEKVEEGNLNLKSDFNRLCKIDLEKVGTYGELIDRLRALTHGSYKNAYFIDEKGNKVFVSIELEKTNNPS